MADGPLSVSWRLGWWEWGVHVRWKHYRKGGVPWRQAVSAEPPDSAAAAAGAVGMLTCGQATLCSALHPSSSSSYRARAAQGVHREGGPFTPVGLGPEGEVFVFTFGALGTASGLLLGLSIPFYAQKGVHL